MLGADSAAAVLALDRLVSSRPPCGRTDGAAPAFQMAPGQGVVTEQQGPAWVLRAGPRSSRWAVSVDHGERRPTRCSVSTVRRATRTYSGRSVREPPGGGTACWGTMGGWSLGQAVGLATAMRSPGLQGPPNGRRRTLGNLMATVGGGVAVVAGLASFLQSSSTRPEVIRRRRPFCGLHGGSWGLYAVAIGVALAVAAMLAALMVWRLRFVVVSGQHSLWPCRVRCELAPPRHAEHGRLVTGPPGAGLVVTAAAFGVAVLVAVTLLCSTAVPPKQEMLLAVDSTGPRADVAWRTTNHRRVVGAYTKVLLIRGRTRQYDENRNALPIAGWGMLATSRGTLVRSPPAGPR